MTPPLLQAGDFFRLEKNLYDRGVVGPTPERLTKGFNDNPMTICVPALLVATSSLGCTSKTAREKTIQWPRPKS